MDCCLHMHVHEQTDIRTYTCSPRFGHRLLPRAVAVVPNKNGGFCNSLPSSGNFFYSKIKSQEKQLQKPQLIYAFKIGVVKGIIAALRMFFIKSIAPCVPSVPLWYSFGKFLS